MVRIVVQAGLVSLLVAGSCAPCAAHEPIGREVAVARHLRDGDEKRLSPLQLIAHGKILFEASWTIQEGAGRPFSKGTGAPLSDPTSPLRFPRDFNRLSAPDANSCAGCHNAPFGIVGGGGDNSRNTLGMFGAGFIEMLARQITGDLQRVRNKLPLGGSVSLISKGISFGVLTRRHDGSWDVSQVKGLSAPSLASSAGVPPSLIVRPFHQAGNVVSLRQFTNNAFNHHHGIQPTERFGDGTDPDQDGFVDELSRADVTAAVLFQATLPVPGRVLPRDPAHAVAVVHGEALFRQIGCPSCHVPALQLDRHGWIFTEPSPFNPPGNATPADTSVVRVDLTDARLPGPRLKPHRGVLWVPRSPISSCTTSRAEQGT